MGLAVWWSQFRVKRMEGLLIVLVKSILFILLPAISAYGSLRFQYSLPFIIYILWDFQNVHDWRLPATCCLFVAAVTNIVSLSLFAMSFKFVNLYFFRLPSVLLPVFVLFLFGYLAYHLRHFFVFRINRV